MTDVTQGADSAPEAPVSVISSGGDSPLSVKDAARTLAKARYEKPKDEPASAPVAAAEESTPTGDDAASQETETTGETQETEPAEPAIEPPRSWTKDARERWSKLDRDTQRWLVTRDSEDQAAIKRGLNEAAEQRKAVEADRQKAEQARQQYEHALPQLLQTLQEAQAGEFSDIKTVADLENLARNDPYRYSLWDLSQKKVAAVQQQVQAAQQRQQQTRQQEFSKFAEREDNLLNEKIPELADKAKARELQDDAVETLKSLGFVEKDLAQAWNGWSDISLRDHRVQLLIRDATLWRKAQAKAKSVVTKPVPPVQRPGTSQPKGAAKEAEIQNLTKRLDNTSGNAQLRAAASLLRAKRAAR